LKRLAIAGSNWACASFPLVALAAEQSILRTDPQLLPWFTWAWVFGLSLGGWFASSAPTLAGWIDPKSGDGDGEHRRELWARRWTIVGRLAACLVAGFACFFGGLLMGTPMVANFLAVLFASYGGDKYLQMQAERVAARAPPGQPGGDT
jgi:hypothetical protein